MIEVGKNKVMKINNLSKIGVYLDAETGDALDNILLPNNQILGKNFVVGQEIEVFIYRDSSDRLIATLKEPKLKVGEIGKLKVVDKAEIGYFLDLGLERDLFMPKKEAEKGTLIGQEYLVYMYVDKSDRLCATMKIHKLLNSTEKFNVGELVKGTVYQLEEKLGAFIAVENQFYGKVAKELIFTTLELGKEYDFYVTRITEDFKLDLSFGKLKLDQQADDWQKLLNHLKEHGGVLDESLEADDIREKYQMSKKAFKRAIGILFKMRRVTRTDKGFVVNEHKGKQ
ncbi:MAG: S1-like domain-containing RNA-binding protein [Fusobacteria bacterium]|nr:S1-like domain-containing RNA-binding protein [Fusobacteriota bacterium]